MAVLLPALLAGACEFLGQRLAALAGLPGYAGSLTTAALALVAALIYLHTLSRLVLRLTADVERARADRAVQDRRQALADDLHDTILQTLFFLNVRLRKARGELPGGAGPLGEDLAAAAAATEEAYLHMRGALARLREGGSAAGAGARSLAELAAAAGGGGWEVRIEPGSAAPTQLEPQRWSALQAILLEALRNARKHAGA